MAKIDIFVTSDFKLVAFLDLKGHTYQVDKGENGKPTMFIFDKNVPLVESLVREFGNGSYSLRYANKLREIKMIVIGDYKKDFHKK